MPGHKPDADERQPEPECLDLAGKADFKRGDDDGHSRRKYCRDRGRDAHLAHREGAVKRRHADAAR
jgi:hypothetical protein